jgi:AcrR family transcriptional regulator
MARTSHSREPAIGSGRLNGDAVVDAALALIAERGLEGLSMRALGDTLGVEAMSLYHWFPAKERLLDAIADRLIRKVHLPPTPTAAGWKQWMIDAAGAYRRMGHGHPRAFPLVGTRRFLSPGAVVFLQATIAASQAAGFDMRQCLQLTRSIGAFVNGMILIEIMPPAALHPINANTAGRLLDDHQWKDVMALIRRPALDGAFEYGLNRLLDGALQNLRERGAHRAKRKTSRRAPRI